MDAILDVDLLAFEEGTAAERSAVVDGTMRSLETGFVYTAHDVSSGLIDQAYEMLATFFSSSGNSQAKRPRVFSVRTVTFIVQTSGIH